MHAHANPQSHFHMRIHIVDGGPEGPAFAGQSSIVCGPERLDEGGERPHTTARGDRIVTNKCMRA